MTKRTAVALALAGSLLAGPAAVASPVEPAGAAPGYRLEHAGHDHGAKPDKPKPKPKPDKGKRKRRYDDSAHASGGYDSHRHHPRNW